MSALPPLDRELLDLGIAIGLVREDAGGLSLDSSWFDAPAARLASALADDRRRRALISFAEAVLADGEHTEQDGVTIVPVFDLRRLPGANHPDVSIDVTIDGRHPSWVEVGVAARIGTTTPATSTQVQVPIYRARKGTAPVPQPFPLLGDGRIRLATELTLQPGPVAPGDFGLAGVGFAIETPLSGGPPSVRLALRGLHLPGASTAIDVELPGPTASLEASLLQLVLGIARQRADALTGPAAAQTRALLALLGLAPGTGGAIPALPIDDVIATGSAALRAWIGQAVRTSAQRTAWLEAIAALLGGAVASDGAIVIGAGAVSIRIAIDVSSGPDGAPRVTPSITIAIGRDLADVRVDARATVDVLTVDTADGSVRVLPRAALAVTAAGLGSAKLLDTSTIDVGRIHVGLALRDGDPEALVELHDVVFQGAVHPVLDLSSPSAVVAAAGQVATTLVGQALDSLGPAAADVKALLGFEAIGGVAAIDGGRLLADPLGAVAAWWQSLLASTDATAVPSVLARLRNLVAGAADIARPVVGAGTVDAPWSVPVAGPVTLDCWREDDRIVVAAAASFRVDDLAGGCTVATTRLGARIVELDIVQRRASFLAGVELTTSLRARGASEARVSLGAVPLVADRVGLAARWSPDAGFRVALDAPNLAVDLDRGRIPLALPSIGVDGSVVFDPTAWRSVEALLGVLAANAPMGWFADLVRLAGWSLDGRARGPRLDLAAVVADPHAALSAWVGALIADGETVATITAALARLTTGTRDVLGGILEGAGTPSDPWLAALGSGASRPAIAVWLTPDGPRRDATHTSEVLRSWRPGTNGLDADGLARAVFDDGRAGDDVAALGAGRAELASGLEAVARRWRGTDGLVAPPEGDIPGVVVRAHPDLDARALATLPIEEVLGAPLPAGAAVVHVAVTAPDALPWTTVPGRVLDLTAPGRDPSSFTVASPDAGDWFVALAPRAVASLGVGDPTGINGQTARLTHVLTPLADGRPVVVVAWGAAGHAARVAADAVAGVTHLVTLGTPWSPVAFDTARTGASADALRLLRALLPPADPAEPDDEDLGRGRRLVDALLGAARGTATVADLEAPRPTTSVRAGLTTVAVFGVLSDDAVARAMTAIVAAALAVRARTRAATALAPATALHVGLHLPVSRGADGTPGTVVTGAVDLHVASVDFAARRSALDPHVRVRLDVGAGVGWLLGGPGTTPDTGAAPFDLRRLSLRAEIGLGGTPSTASVVLHEGAALGASWDRLVVSPPTDVSGALEALPLLPEARALLAALTLRLHAAVDAGASALTALLRAIGLARVDGALVPDALSHLLHDPDLHLRAIVASAPTRDALVAAIAGLLDGATAAAGAIHVATGPLTLDADLGAGTIGVTATGAEGQLPWRIAGSHAPGRAPSFEMGLGAATDALALRVASGPWRAELAPTGGGAPIALWPAPDLPAITPIAVGAVTAEAVRLLIEGLRAIDNELDDALDALGSAIGILAPADASGRRAVRVPLTLFTDPGAHFRGLLADGAGALRADALVDVFESLKPFVGLGGARGSWAITSGVTLVVSAGAAGPVIALDIDATAWRSTMAGAAPFAAGLRAALTLRAGVAPVPSLHVFLGAPDGPGGSSTPQHRRAVHLDTDGGAVRVWLRPTAGPDVELHPNLAGLGDLLQTGVQQLVPMVLDALARMTGGIRGDVGSLVGAVGRGLAIATGTPATFDGDALRTLAQDPAAHLRARAAALLAEGATAIDAVLQQVLALGAGQHALVVGGDGTATITVGGIVVEVRPNPLQVRLEGAIDGVDVVGRVGASLSADQSGLAAWSVSVGPAVVDLGGPVLRPVVRAGATAASGWQAELGLALDASDVSADGHRELVARWQSSAALRVVATTRTASGLEEHDDEASLATAAAGAVLDLLGGWVLGVPDVRQLLRRHVGATSTLADVLAGSILDATAPPTAPRLLPGVLEGWPAKLFVLAGHLASAAPGITIDGFRIGLVGDGGVLGIALSTTNAAALELTSSSELRLVLEADASWIEPPTGSPPAPGIVVGLLRVSGTPTAAPSVAVNGIGLRLSKVTGPLVDAGVRLESVAIHGFGRIAAAGGAPVLAGGIHVELGGLAVPLAGAGGTNAVARGVLEDAGGAGSPPRPAFSPAVAVQSHGGGMSLTLRAGSGDGPWYVPIQRAFGPVYLEQVGLGVGYRPGVTPRQLETVSVLLDGSVSLLGLTASVDRLRLSYRVGQPAFSASSWEVDVEGFAVAADISGLRLAGALRKATLAPPLSGTEYLGMLKVGFGSYGVDVFGGYAHATTADGQAFASFFAFGVVHAPIGGPPAFFITGIALGFGINRELRTPDVASLPQHPFMQSLRALGPTPDPKAQLEAMRGLVRPSQGEYWVAAGISFTSFVLITGELLVTVQFGDGLDVAILGMARAELPSPGLTLVSVELALVARFSTKEGALLVQAQLTESSWVLHRSVRLTGGFAFATWWKGPNAGQFVVTVGGYHPRFHHDGYPVVPRVGLRWQPIDNISVVGELYFALCSEAIMAGASLQVAAHLGPARVRASFGGDGIVFFDPFWFQVDVYAEINVGIRIWLLFGSVDLELTFGADVRVQGPPIFVSGHFSVHGISIPFEFGDRSDPAERALDAAAFVRKYLRADNDAQVVQATVTRGALVAGRSASGGQDRPPDGSVAHPFRVAPEFRLAFVSVAPVESVAIVRATEQKSASVPATDDLGVAPMNSPTLDTSLTVTLSKDVPGAFTLTKVSVVGRGHTAFPKGVWGLPASADAKVIPKGETVDASDGLVIDAVLPELTGAPPIDYHQVELPFHGRRPLPFVTNTAQHDARRAGAAALADAASVLLAGELSTEVRFERAAIMLEAGGSGATTVAALRGERAAAPRFGSLADDLDIHPPPVSTSVDHVVVDRTRPEPRRVAPMVKAILSAPRSHVLERAGATTVADHGGAIRRLAPTYGAVRDATRSLGTYALSLVPSAAVADRRVVTARGTAPLTRLATAPVAAVANARPSPLAAARLAQLSDDLVHGSADDGGGAIVHEGDVAVLATGGGRRREAGDAVVVAGGRTRVLAIAPGGSVLDDRVVDGAEPTAVEVPPRADRVAIVAEGDAGAVGGTIDGWCAGQALPTIGWGLALAGGAIVAGRGARVDHHRERADGGWVRTDELARAPRVVTTFTDPVDAVAVVVDDPAGDDAAARVSMRLLDAERVRLADGELRPPEALVLGVRTILLYAIEPTGPDVAVIVDGSEVGNLAGVLGSARGVDALADALSTDGVEASVRAPLVGGPGQRQVAWRFADGVPTDHEPRRVVPKRRRRTAARRRS